MRPFYALVAVVSCTLLSIPGCALHEYESRMDVQRRRLEILDEENRYLSPEAIRMPTVEAEKKEANKPGGQIPAWPFEVFLRLPKEVKSLPEEAIYQAPKGDLRLFRYKGSDIYSFFVAAGIIGEEKTKDGKARPREYSVAEFRDRVRGAFLDYYRKEYRVKPSSDFLLVNKLSKYTKQTLTDLGEPGPTIEYDAVAYKDTFNPGKEPGIFEVYFHQKDPRQVAIIVEFPATWKTDENFRTGLDMSLKTLEVVPYLVNVKRQAILNRRR